MGLVEREIPKHALFVDTSKTYPNGVPFLFAGFVTADCGDQWRVAVYGAFDVWRGFIGVAYWLPTPSGAAN